MGRSHRFKPLTDYRGTPDLFGRPLQVTLRNIADGISAVALAVMDEGNESTPAAVVTDIPFAHFTSRPYRSKNPRDDLLVKPRDDVFYPLLRNAAWKKRRDGKGIQKLLETFLQNSIKLVTIVQCGP